MKTDARVRYTCMVIRQSFFQLLKEKPVSKITVKEICDRSEINRATFYKHYRDPFDLLERIEEEMLTRLQDTLQQKKYRNIKALYTDVLIQIKSNREQYENIGSAHGDSSFSHRIFMTCYKQAFPLIAGQFSHLNQTQQNMLYYFITQGCSGTVQYWMESGMQESPEEVAAFIEETIHAITEHYKNPT
ncbi:MAG: TetR/AcrR family transcriptional regulator [Oliverpabstia sp.]